MISGLCTWFDEILLPKGAKKKEEEKKDKWFLFIEVNHYEQSPATYIK